MLHSLVHSLPETTCAHCEEGKFHTEGWELFSNADGFRAFELQLEATEIMKGMEALGERFEDAGFTFALGAHLFGSQWVLEQVASPSPWVASVREKARNGAHIAHAITEPDSGSDIFAMGTTAALTREGYLLKGHKAFISGLFEAEYALVYAYTDASKGALGGVSGFLLHQSDWEVAGRYEKMGLTTCSMGQMALNVTLSPDRIVGQIGGGYRQFMGAMNWERIGLSAIHVGTMRKVLRATKAFCNQRKQGGVPISDHQSIAFQLADMSVATESSAQLVHWAAGALDSNIGQKELTRRAAIAKLHVSESLVAVCRTAIQLHGGVGYLKGTGPERWMRDALSSTIYSGTSEMQRKLIFGLM